MTDDPSWDDDEYWREKGDGPLRRRLRRHQGWWRETELNLPAGHIPRRDRPVLSMLPETAPLSANLWTEESRRAFADASTSLKGRPGLIQEERVRRNLLSSQPLCFNLFGYLRAHPEAVLPWVASIEPSAERVERIELEWSTRESAIGGSAFDAFVEFSDSAGEKGFLGVECKYAERLTETLRDPASAKFRDVTVPPRWLDGAADVLDRNGIRQFWYNTLLAQRVMDVHGYVRARSVVVAMAEDDDARRAVDTVASQLQDGSFMLFVSLQDVVSSVQGHDTWRKTFTRRYTALEASGSVHR